MTKKKLLQKFKSIIADWYEPAGEEFKYDIMLKDGYSWDDPLTDRQCRTIEHFETLAQVAVALRNVVKAAPEHCASCRFFNNGHCSH